MTIYPPTNNSRTSGDVSSAFISLIYVLPFVLIAASSLMFLFMENRIAIATGGRNDPEFIDTMFRWGSSGGWYGFFAFQAGGSLLWFFAFIYSLRSIIQKKPVSPWSWFFVILTPFCNLWVILFLREWIMGAAPEL